MGAIAKYQCYLPDAHIYRPIRVLSEEIHLILELSLTR